MPYPTQEEVRAVLSPYHQRIRRVVERAWGEWKAVSDFRAERNFGAILYSRTMANYVFDRIAKHAIAEFAGDVSVRVVIESQTIKLFFKGGEVLARFKKGDDSKLGQNNPTQASMAFETANDDDLFGGLLSAIKVEFIWLPNDISTGLDRVLVVARDGDRRLWDYEIDVAEDGTNPVIPIPPTPPANPENEILVTPKPSAGKKSDRQE